jgi:hypothetical protein
MTRLLAAFAISFGVLLTTLPGSVGADDALDFGLTTGHFFTQTNGTNLGPRGGGFSITDNDGIPFWTFFSTSGGVDSLGYPVSQRFSWDGYVCQATQRGILQWNPTTNTVQLANVLDYLSQIGKDDWLAAAHLAPKPQKTEMEQQMGALPLSFLMLAHYRFSWLYADPALFHRYFSTPDYYAQYGLPTSSVQDLGPYQALRTQRAVLYHWKFSVPWADDRGVSVGLAGDLFKELGLIPTAALRPETSTNAGAPGQPLPSISSLAAAATAPVAPSRQAPAPAAPQPAPAPAPRASSLPVLIGVATWYGGDFQGQPMYNGQIYDMYNPRIAASNLYPIGTWLRITRLTTGQSIVVQVTDRGAFTYPDITDLSYGAFSLLANPAIGVIGVRVEPVDDPG